MSKIGCHQNQEIVLVSALDLLSANYTLCKKSDIPDAEIVQEERENDIRYPAILSLKFPFKLKPDQLDAVDAWLLSKYRGSIIYSSGTGKTEIAFECARRTAQMFGNPRFDILVLVPRIVLIEQNYTRLVRYGIPPMKIGRYFGEKKDIREITISTYQSAAANLDIVKKADMIILDEVHLASATA